MNRHIFLTAAMAALIAVPSFSARAADPAKPDQSINAMVIGISYGRAPQQFHLGNTLSDASLVASFLQAEPGRRVQFVKDPDVQELRSSVNQYLNRLQSNDIAFIYYAGHGVQMNGSNYIVSDDAAALIPIADIVVQARKRARLVLLFLDACRNNPFARQTIASTAGRSIALVNASTIESPGDLSDLTRGAKINAIPLDSNALRASQGLAQFELQGRGVKVIFATDPGNVALDGVGSATNSPFTRSLVKALAQRKSLDEVLADVTKDVVAQTHGAQTPWVQGSLEETVFISGRPSRFNTGERSISIP